MKRLMLLLAMSCGTMSAMQVFKPHDLGNVQLAHDGSRFKVLKDQAMIDVQPAFVDKELRQLSSEKLNGLLKSGAYLKLNKMENSPEYSVRLGQRLNGGGLAGAAVGAYVAGGAVAAIGHGTIGLIAACSGPAAPAVAGALEFWFFTPIAIAAKAAAVAGGIVGAVVTGPV